MPRILRIDGAHLVLNGIALRTYSIFGIHVYVAGLYLEHRSDSAAAILHSLETKVLEFRFLRGISRADAQDAWRKGFAKNCRAPCYLTPQDITRFIAKVPPIHRGDVSMFLFTRKGLTVTFDGREIGTTNRYFAHEVLRTFLGPAPPTRQLKRELLGDR